MALQDRAQAESKMMTARWRRLVACALASSGLASPACAQTLACHYEIADVIQAPACGIFGPPSTVPVAMSLNGRYVVGYHASCVTDYFESFVYDRQTKSFTRFPAQRVRSTRRPWV